MIIIFSVQLCILFNVIIIVYKYREELCVTFCMYYLLKKYKEFICIVFLKVELLNTQILTNNALSFSFKGKGAELYSDKKSADLSADFTFYPPVLFVRVSFQPHREHTVLPYLCALNLSYTLPRYEFKPESSIACEGKVSCPGTHHQKNVPILRGEKHDISLKILHQVGLETAQQAATLL